METILKILAFLLVGFVVVYVGLKNDEKKLQKKIEETFAGRKPLTDAEFYREFYLNEDVSEDVVTRIKRLLQDNLLTDLSRLHKNDSFSENLAFFFEYDDMADVEIVIALEHEFSIEIEDEEASNSHSFDDIIQLVWRKTNF